MSVSRLNGKRELRLGVGSQRVNTALLANFFSCQVQNWPISFGFAASLNSRSNTFGNLLFVKFGGKTAKTNLTFGGAEPITH